MPQKRIMKANESRTGDSPGFMPAGQETRREDNQVREMQGERRVYYVNMYRGSV